MKKLFQALRGKPIIKMPAPNTHTPAFSVAECGYVALPRDFAPQCDRAPEHKVAHPSPTA